MIDCIIPARAGSKGIPKKNIILIEQLPLIAYTIFVAKNLKGLIIFMFRLIQKK